MDGHKSMFAKYAAGGRGTTDEVASITELGQTK